MKHSLEVDHWKITSKLWSNKFLKLQIPVFNICVNLSAQLQKKFKMSFWSFQHPMQIWGQMGTPKMLVGFSFFDENG